MMSKKQAFVSVVFFLFLGYFIGLRDQKPRKQQQEVVASDEYKQKYEKLKSQLESSALDYEEYVKLQDMKSKYEKADEMLGQMMLIFLADLGLRISDQANEQAQQSAGGEAPKYEKKKEEVVKEVVEKKKEQEKPKVALEGWRSQEGGLEAVKTSSEVKEFLDKTEIKDLFSEIRSATPLSRKLLMQIRGQFSGNVFLSDKERTVWDVEMSLRGRIEEGAVKGGSRIILSKDGDVFSRSSGKGDIRRFKQFAGDSKAVLVSVQGGRGYFQLYPANNLNSLIGNYYGKIREGEFAKKGVVRLERE